MCEYVRVVVLGSYLLLGVRQNKNKEWGEKNCVRVQNDVMYTGSRKGYAYDLQKFMVFITII